MDTAKCHYPHRHKSGCGCISGQYITAARSKFFRTLVDVGTKPENFVTRMKILPRHARDEYEWEDGSVASTPSRCAHVDIVTKVM